MFPSRIKIQYVERKIHELIQLRKSKFTTVTREREREKREKKKYNVARSPKSYSVPAFFPYYICHDTKNIIL